VLWKSANKVDKIGKSITQMPKPPQRRHRSDLDTLRSLRGIGNVIPNVLYGMYFVLLALAVEMPVFFSPQPR
jgi:hypothetical protein